MEFDGPVHSWRDIPGWFQWRRHQEEAAAHFADGSRFVEVGLYLGRSICSLGEVVREAGLDIRIVGVDTARVDLDRLSARRDALKAIQPVRARGTYELFPAPIAAFPAARSGRHG